MTGTLGSFRGMKSEIPPAPGEPPFLWGQKEVGKMGKM